MVLPDILLIDKPSGMTSFDVIRILRKKTGIRKFGHAGTLDPLASGLLIIGVEKGTKKLAEYLKLDKEYVAGIRVGERRTTGDTDGAIIETAEVPLISADAAKDALLRLIGELSLPVSAYSAIKKDGVAMYKRAHAAEKRGELVPDIENRPMRVHDAELLSVEPLQADGRDMCVVTVRLYVGSGTYIRSLAEEFGRSLGYPAAIQSLRRTRIGEFSVSDARELESIE
jgi:tRNA pseudouridine55 synthase